MGQKVNPVGMRLGIVKTWESRWYAGKDYSDFILEDHKIRKFVDKMVRKWKRCPPRAPFYKGKYLI